MTASYLSEMEGPASAVNLFDLGPELTRPCRGLRLWFTLRAVGEQGIADAIERGFENAEVAERLGTSPATLYRYLPTGGRFNRLCCSNSTNFRISGRTCQSSSSGR